MVKARVRGIASAALVVGLLAAASLVQSTAYADSRREAEQRADQLRKQARTTAGGLAAAQGQLAELATRANAALDTYQRAAEAARAAQTRQQVAQRQLAAASAAATDQRRRVSVYVTNLYRRGGVAQVTLIVDLAKQQTPEETLQTVGNLKLVGQRQSDTLTAMRVIRLREHEARAIADQAAAVTTSTLKGAGAAKQRADALMATQQQLVASLQTQLDRTQGAARAAQARAKRLALAEALAQQRGSRSYGPVGSCRGGDVSGYPNGRLPESALCPLWGASGHRLRADAANGFNGMSKAFAAQFGSPICVTDSYRTYSEQQRLYAEKPGYAARPGTSNHGWGLAADLCGDIARDGTSSNNWLRQNAGRFGWFHPSWADRGGSGAYEPWHWEYAGGQ